MTDVTISTATDATPVPDGEDAYAAIERLGAAPLWREYGDLFPREPRSAAVPFVWRYRELRPYLDHFVEALSLEEAERRVLMLTNPGLGHPPATVTMLYAGLQVIAPGETAQAHRHTSHAFRYVIEGGGAYTTVNGERLHMSPGDLLLTPGWHWHDHQHNGDAPMVWLDALDYPLTNALDAGFFELFHERTQPATVPDDLSSRQFVHGQLVPGWIEPSGDSSPIGNYPWSETERAFSAIADDADGSASEGIVLRYTNPWTGGDVLPTIACQVSRLRPGYRGAPMRRTPGSIHHVVRGTGRTIVDGTTLDWSDKDVVAVPAWSTFEHHNTSTTEDAYLFTFTNEPVIRALGYYREDGGA